MSQTCWAPKWLKESNGWFWLDHLWIQWPKKLLRDSPNHLSFSIISSSESRGGFMMFFWWRKILSKCLERWLGPEYHNFSNVSGFWFYLSYVFYNNQMANSQHDPQHHNNDQTYHSFIIQAIVSCLLEQGGLHYSYMFFSPKLNTVDGSELRLTTWMYIVQNTKKKGYLPYYLWNLWKMGKFSISTDARFLNHQQYHLC